MATEKRTERVSIYLTPTELRALDLAAEVAQRERRDYVRRVLLTNVHVTVREHLNA